MLAASLGQRSLLVEGHGGDAVHGLDGPGLGESRAIQMSPAEGAPTHAAQARGRAWSRGRGDLLAWGVGVTKEMQKYL